MANITYTDKISVSDYNALRASVGWSQIEEEMAQTGLDHTWFLIVGKDGDKTISCLRLVGDGGYCMLIDDVMVHPDYQGQGIATHMMNECIAYVKRRLKPGQTTMVDLMAAKNRETFYLPFGFQLRPNDDHGAGMTQWIKYEE